MQHIFHTVKILTGTFLITMLLITSTFMVFPASAQADEHHGTENVIKCSGFIHFGACIDTLANGGEKDLAGANLQGKNLSGANLSQAKLSGANLSSVDLSGANLAGANFKGANFNGTDLSGIKLSKQDLIALIKINMSGGGWFQSTPILNKEDLLRLIEPDLHQLVLSGDNLSEVNLSGANLSKVNLIGANLQEAKLGGVDLTGADLTGAKMPNGKIYKP